MITINEPEINFITKKDLSILNINENTIIENDALDTLKNMIKNKQLIDFIYIDPPYNTKKKGEFRYSDTFEINKYLEFTYEYLFLAKQVLKESGSIMISIDDESYHWLKMICDYVFGNGNFLSTFIWKKTYSVKNDKVGISNQHEYILFYGKNKKETFIKKDQNVSEEYIKRAYRNFDEKGRYRLCDLHKAKNKNFYTWVAPNGKKWHRGWNYNKEGMDKLESENMIYYGKDGNGIPSRKLYLKEKMEKNFVSFLPSEKVGYSGDGAKVLKKLGFQQMDFIYAKPPSLIKYLFSISLPKNAIVMDFFAGSGTTAQAVIEYNKENNDNVRCILNNKDENNIVSGILIPRVNKVCEIENEKKFKTI